MSRRIDQPAKLALPLVAVSMLYACGGSGGGGAAQVQNEQVSTALSTIEVTPPSILANGTTEATLTVTVRNDADQPVANIPVQITVSGSGNTLLQSANESGADGVVTATLSSTTPEPKTVSATMTVNNQALAIATTAQVEFTDATGPKLAGISSYVDADSDGALSAGDLVIAQFDRIVQVLSQDPSAFVLPVTGDTLGNPAAIAAGPNGNEVTITLGANPVLRSRGAFAAGNVTPNSPSGLSLPAGAANIIGVSNNQPAEASTPVDIASSFSDRVAQLAAPNASAALFADLNRDGLIDVWVGTDGQDQLFTGDGAFGFTAAFTSQVNAPTRAVLVADLDGRGPANDLLTAHDSFTQVWRNDSLNGALDLNPIFQIPSNDTRTLAAGDVDGDGLVDVITGSENGTRTWIHPNALGLQFTLGATFGDNQVRALAAFDADGDGDLDIVTGRENAASQLFRNSGSGDFAGSDLGVTDAHNLAWADVDRDGDIDVVAAREGQAAVLLRNDGSGSFSTETLVPVAADVVLRDFDGDSVADLLATTQNGIELWQNDRSGAFEGPIRVGAGSADLAVGDADLDGDLDVLCTESAGAAIQAGSTVAAFGTLTLQAATEIGAEDSNDVAMGDIDGDGDLDMIFANDGPNQVFVNDGSGSYTLAASLGTVSTEAVALADLDGDRDLDIVFGNGRQSNDIQNEVWQNDGSGAFSLALQLPIADETFSLALGDWDNDGDIDIVVGNRGPNRVFENESTADEILFSEKTNAFNGANQLDRDTDSIALGDLDGDGDLDLITGNSGSIVKGRENHVWLNNGRSQFSFRFEFNQQAERTEAVVLADLDNDGDLDLIVANRSSGPSGAARIHRGLGTGAFNNQVVSIAAGVPSRDADVADVDADGDLDIVLGNGIGTADQIWLNDGQFGFTLDTAISTGLTDGRTSGIAAADIDGDGDIDIVASSDISTPNRVHENR